ncbi:putative nucleic acid-binding, replication factor A [Helianthus annuus]|nr:putative nucleic acid-binding, replication factor A [Helianthus annuus]
MATVNHTASIVIGRKAKFVPVENPNIPSMCFGFIPYDLLFNRIKNNKVLTDFIGRVEKNYPFTTSKKLILTKVVLRDERMNRVEITLWPDKRHLIGPDVGPGNIVAITSTQVSKYSMMQLESTHLTEVAINAINPDTPQTVEYVARLKALPPVQLEDLEDPMLTLLELTSPQRAQEQNSTRFRCHAWIEKIHEKRSWFYVHCSKCDKKVYPEQDGSLNYVCKDDDDISPKFQFFFNAIINDSTKPVDVTFFDEGMVALLKTTCAEMMTNNGYTDPKMLPKEIHDMMGKPKIMHISVRGKQYVVTNVSDPPVVHTSTDNIQQQHMDAPPPKTPNPKLNQQKRHLDECQITATLQRRDAWGAGNDMDVEHLLCSCEVEKTQL